MAIDEQVGGTTRYSAEANLFRDERGVEMLHASVQLPEGEWETETDAEPGARSFTVRLWDVRSGKLHYQWTIECPVAIDPRRRLEIELLEDGILFVEMAPAAISAIARPEVLRIKAA